MGKYGLVVYPEKHGIDIDKVLMAYEFGACAIKHDKDTCEDGIHWHVVCNAPSMARAKLLSTELGGNKYAELIRSDKGMKSYMTHENNPNKFHYSTDDIKVFGDFVWTDNNSSNDISKYEEVVNFCIAERIVPHDIFDFNQAVLEYCNSSGEHFSITTDDERFVTFQVIPRIKRYVAIEKAQSDNVELLKRALTALTAYNKDDRTAVLIESYLVENGFIEA